MVGPGVKYIDSSKIKISLDININEAEADIARVLAISIDRAMRFMAKNFQTIIIDPLILGGQGWKPFINTASWKWLNSPKGYAQMGFSSGTTPLRLLNILRKSWTAKAVSRKTGKGLSIGFFFNWADLSEVFKATIHPSAGQLNLPAGQSWFEWVYAGAPLREEGFHFKKTGPSPGVRSSSIAGAEAGRMVQGGFWEVTPRFRVDLDKLWLRNEKKI